MYGCEIHLNGWFLFLFVFLRNDKCNRKMRGENMGDWKKDRIGSCERGENPTLMVKMKSGFAVMADNQFLPGYCIFLRYPQVASL